MFTPIPEILDELRAGRMVILTDDERRENEGDLVLPAQFASPETITFMLKEAKGYLCLSLTEADCDRLDLVPQSSTNTSVRGTAFTVSIDLHPKDGGTTGVSAKERARCIQRAIDPTTSPADFVRPGHINPLRSRDGGVLVRTGQTEGSIDLCRLAGLTPAACIIEIMRDDGEMARVPDLAEFAKRHNLKMCSVAQIIEHRLKRESLVKRLEPITGSVMRTGGTGGGGEWRVYAYESLVDPLPHVVLTHGLGETLHAGREVEAPTLVRVHRANVLGDVFQDVDSGPAAPTGLTLRHSMEAIEREGRGAIIYLRHETPGDDLAARLMRVRHGGGSTPNSGADVPALSHRDGIASNAMPMQERLVGIGSQILRDLGLTKLRLLTSSPKPGPASLAWPGLDGFGIEIVDQVEISHR